MNMKGSGGREMRLVFFCGEMRTPGAGRRHDAAGPGDDENREEGPKIDESKNLPRESRIRSQRIQKSSKPREEPRRAEGSLRVQSDADMTVNPDGDFVPSNTADEQM